MRDLFGVFLVAACTLLPLATGCGSACDKARDKCDDRGGEPYACSEDSGFLVDECTCSCR